MECPVRAFLVALDDAPSASLPPGGGDGGAGDAELPDGRIGDEVLGGVLASLRPLKRLMMLSPRSNDEREWLAAASTSSRFDAGSSTFGRSWLSPRSVDGGGDGGTGEVNLCSSLTTEMWSRSCSSFKAFAVVLLLLLLLLAAFAAAAVAVATLSAKVVAFFGIGERSLAVPILTFGIDGWVELSELNPMLFSEGARLMSPDLARRLRPRVSVRAKPPGGDSPLTAPAAPRSGDHPRPRCALLSPNGLARFAIVSAAPSCNTRM